MKNYVTRPKSVSFFQEWFLHALKSFINLLTESINQTLIKLQNSLKSNN